MTAVKQRPEVNVWFYPKEAIPKRTRNGVVVSHIYSDLVKRDWADMLEEVQDFNPTISTDWIGQPAFTSIDGYMMFVRFYKDGRVEFTAAPGEKNGEKGDIAGWALRRRLAPLDCKIGSTALDTDKFDLNWKKFQGKWETRLPNRNPQATCLCNVGTELTARVQTKGDIAERRGLQWDIGCNGILDPAGPTPRVACTMPRKAYRTLLPHGAKPVVQIPNGSGGWSTIRTLKDLPTVNLSRGHYRVEMFILIDRLIVGVNGRYFHIIEMKKPVSPSAQAEPKRAHWPAGPIQLNVHNCRVTAGVSLMKWATPDDVPYVGAFAATAKKKTYLEPGELIAHATGHSPAGATIDAVAEINGNAIDYTVTLTASPEGIETPLVTKCLINRPPVWEAPSAAGINVKAALGNWSVTGAMPPIMPGTEATVELDRVMLKKLFGDSTSTGWQKYVKDDHPCEILARWACKDDVTGALSYDPPEVSGEPRYWRLFLGYLFRPKKETRGYLQNSMSINTRDPIVRLQGESARIDYRYPPMDLVMLNKAKASSTAPLNQSASPLDDLEVYGSDVVQEILRITGGDAQANVLNGGTNVEHPTETAPRRFYPYDSNNKITAGALLSTKKDAGGLLALYGALGQNLTQNGWNFPAPFGEDAATWINKIAELDHCVFFYGWPNSDFKDSWPVPIYGRITEILKRLHPTQSTFITIPDDDYIAGDVNRLLEMASTESRPDRRINRVIALGDPPTGGLETILPSLRIGEARLDPSDINSAEQSWERTLILRNSIYMSPGSAEAAAGRLIKDIAGRIMQFPDVTFRGTPVQWGAICQVKAENANSDTSLGLNGLPFRVEQYTHSGTGGQNATWSTTVKARPLSTTELEGIPA